VTSGRWIRGPASPSRLIRRPYERPRPGLSSWTTWHAALNVWRVQDPRPQEWVALALSGNLPPPFGIMIETLAGVPLPDWILSRSGAPGPVHEVAGIPAQVTPRSVGE